MEDGARPRITPGRPEEIGRLNALITRLIGAATGGPPPNLFTTLARHRRLFRAWLRFAGLLMPRGSLPRRDTELVILRVAHNCGSAYEREHHERLGAQAGLGAEEIERTTGPADAPGWTAHEAALLRAADELHAERRMTDATWAALARAYDEPRLIELCLLIGHYEMLAMTLNTLRVEPDAPPPPGRRAAAILDRVARRRSR